MRRLRPLLLALVVLTCDDSTGPAPGLEGVWLLAEYVDAGVVGRTTGTMTFNPSGAFVTEGRVTYPGEPEDSLTTSGSWSQTDWTVTLTADGETGRWQITGGDLRVTLRLLGQTPITRIVLQRPIR
jgi:hypothetical protein